MDSFVLQLHDDLGGRSSLGKGVDSLQNALEALGTKDLVFIRLDLPSFNQLLDNGNVRSQILVELLCALASEGAKDNLLDVDVGTTVNVRPEEGLTAAQWERFGDGWMHYQSLVVAKYFCPVALLFAKAFKEKSWAPAVESKILLKSPPVIEARSSICWSSLFL